MLNLKLKYADTFTRDVRKKQEIAIKTFKEMYTKEEQKSKQKILDEVCEQIEICEGFCRPVTEKQIREWLQCANVEQVLRKARSHKAA